MIFFVKIRSSSLNLENPKMYSNMSMRKTEYQRNTIQNANKISSSPHSGGLEPPISIVLGSPQALPKHLCLCVHSHMYRYNLKY